MKIEWKKKFEIGIEAIDAQHKVFLSIISKISESAANKVDPSMIKRLLKELIKYADFHFCSEENEMFRVGFPDLEAHQQAHANLLTQLHGKLVSTDYIPDSNAINHILDFLIQWFLHHTLNKDQELARYLKNRPTA